MEFSNSQLLYRFNDIPLVTSINQRNNTEQIQLRKSEWRNAVGIPTSDVVILVTIHDTCLFPLASTGQLTRSVMDKKKTVFEKQTFDNETEMSEQMAMSVKEKYLQLQPQVRVCNKNNLKKHELHQLCTMVREKANSNRIIFHYIGLTNESTSYSINSDSDIVIICHVNGKHIETTSIVELCEWLGTPTVIILDCSYSGKMVDQVRSVLSNKYTADQIMIMASCSREEINKENMSFFTNCLIDPLRTAISMWSGFANSKKNAIKGSLSDRSTPMGHLNWILTAITDSIAWKTLSKRDFQTFYRQDILLSCLCRNFMMAQRLSYPNHPQCTIFSVNYLKNELWYSWDLALDIVMLTGKRSSFFDHQLTGFEHALNDNQNLENQYQTLPILLQALLSFTYRRQTLYLVVRFMNISIQCVELMLVVGALPYTLRLLKQIHAGNAEFRHFLLVIWSKILAVDRTCQIELIKENCHKHFMNILQPGNVMQSKQSHTCDRDCSLDRNNPTFWNDEHLALFCLSCIVDGYELAQIMLVDASLIPILCHFLGDYSDQLRLSLTALTLERLGNNGRSLAILNNAVEHISLGLQNRDLNADCRAALVSALKFLLGSDAEVDKQIAALILELRFDLNVYVRQQVFLVLSTFAKAFNPQFKEFSNKNLLEHQSDDDTKWVPIESVLHGADKSGKPYQSINLFTRIYQSLEELRRDPYIHLFNLENDQYYHPFYNLVRKVAAGNSLTLQQIGEKLNKVIIDTLKTSHCDNVEKLIKISSTPSAKLVIHESAQTCLNTFLPLVAIVDVDNVFLVSLNQPDSNIMETSHKFGNPSAIKWLNEQYDRSSIVICYDDGSSSLYTMANDESLIHVDGFRTEYKFPIVDWNCWLQQLLITSRTLGSTGLYDIEKQICIRNWASDNTTVQCRSDMANNGFAVIHQDGFVSLYDVRQKRLTRRFKHPSKDSVVYSNYEYFSTNTCMTISSNGIIWSNERVFDRLTAIDKNVISVVDATVNLQSKSILLGAIKKATSSITVTSKSTESFDQFYIYNRNFDNDAVRSITLHRGYGIGANSSVDAAFKAYVLSTVNLHPILPIVTTNYTHLTNSGTKQKFVRGVDREQLMCVFTDALNIKF
ncbi:hypothetical protein GJ496_010293 [Pomphorhynchus laevis]|nr:hypothetical protein GJ496_010293 [Pomphorhynchus laevis]